MSGNSSYTLDDGDSDNEGSRGSSVIGSCTSQASCAPCSKRKSRPRRNKCGRSRSRSKPRRRKRSSCSKKRCRAGMRTRNPFFNFLRDFRREHCGQSAAKTAKQAARVWNKMEDSEKLKYVKIACNAKPYKKKLKRLGKKRCRSRSRSRSRSRRSRSRGRRACR